MTVMSEFLKIFYLLVIGHGIFLFTILVSKKGNAGRIFTALVLLATFELLIQYSHNALSLPDTSLLFAMRNASSFMYGVLFYFFIRALHCGPIRPRPARCVHFLIPSLFLVLELRRVFGRHPDPMSSLHGVSIYGLFYYSALISTTLFYLCLSIRAMKAPDNTIRAGRAVRTWHAGLIVYSLTLLAMYAAASFFQIRHSALTRLAAHLFCFYLVVPIYAAAYLCIFKYSFFTQAYGFRSADADCAKDTGKKYARTKLDDQTLSRYFNTINSFISDSKTYLDPELCLQNISDACGIRPDHVSQTINTKYGRSFNMIIMERRLQHAEHLLSSPENAGRSVIDIAFESGFNSKSNFNISFKKVYGMTPSRFRKQNLPSVDSGCSDTRQPPRLIREQTAPGNHSLRSHYFPAVSRMKRTTFS